MKSMVLTLCATLLLLQACNGDNSAERNAPAIDLIPNPANEAVATVRGDIITRGDLDTALTKAYGLNVLLMLVRRDLVHQEADRMHVIVTPQDIAAERSITLENLRQSTQEVTEGAGEPTTQPDLQLTPQQEQTLLDQLLTEKNISRTEFDLAMEVNAYLRKIAEPRAASAITEDAVRQRFNEMYGEKVLVHYIDCNNMTDVAQVRRDLAQGKSFDDVARARSLDARTAYNGGELPPFSLKDNRFPAEFREVAFSLKKGEVSDPIQIEKFIYIIKLIDRIPPAHARFEDYRDSVRKDLFDKTVQAAMSLELQQLAKMAMNSMHIKDPALQEQWQSRVAQNSGQIHDMAQIRSEMDAEHTSTAGAATQPETAPATMPATAPSAR